MWREHPRVVLLERMREVVAQEHGSWGLASSNEVLPASVRFGHSQVDELRSHLADESTGSRIHVGDHDSALAARETSARLHDMAHERRAQRASSCSVMFCCMLSIPRGSTRLSRSSELTHHPQRRRQIAPRMPAACIEAVPDHGTECFEALKHACNHQRGSR